MRRNVAVVLVLAAGFLTVGAVVSIILVITDPPGALYLLGALHMGLLASAMHLINSAFLAHERTAIFQLRGAWGEDNTRSELQRAKRRRLIWGWVDSITLQASDLDHVVVTRRGGIVVLDSKWRSDVTPASVADMAASARRTRMRAEALTRTLIKTERGARHRAAGSLKVTPAVVLWGPARLTVPQGHKVDDVHFVDGRGLIDWLKQLDEQVVTRASARDAVEKLETYRTSALRAMAASAAKH